LKIAYLEKIETPQKKSNLFEAIEAMASVVSDRIYSTEVQALPRAECPKDQQLQNTTNVPPEETTETLS